MSDGPTTAMELLASMASGGDVTSILDARTVLAAYRALCEGEGKSCDQVIVQGE